MERVLDEEEVGRSGRHLHSFQKESADKEVKIVQMVKRHSLDKEDLSQHCVTFKAAGTPTCMIIFFLKKFTCRILSLLPFS